MRLRWYLYPRIRAWYFFPPWLFYTVEPAQAIKTRPDIITWCVVQQCQRLVLMLAVQVPRDVKECFSFAKQGNNPKLHIVNE